MTYSRATNVGAVHSHRARDCKSWPRVLSPNGKRENPVLRFCSPRNQNLVRIFIPALLGQAHNSVVASLRRDVDRSVLHVAATGAWKESLTEGSRSRRSGLTGSGKAPVMAGSRCPPSVAQGAIARLQRWGGAGSQSMARDANRRTRVPKGNPRDREVPESGNAL